MQMYILDGKAFAGLEESGQQHSEHAVDECMLLANNQVSISCDEGMGIQLGYSMRTITHFRVWSGFRHTRQPCRCEGDRFGASVSVQARAEVALSSALAAKA